MGTSDWESKGIMDNLLNIGGPFNIQQGGLPMGYRCLAKFLSVQKNNEIYEDKGGLRDGAGQAMDFKEKTSVWNSSL